MCRLWSDDGRIGYHHTGCHPLSHTFRGLWGSCPSPASTTAPRAGLGTGGLFGFAAGNKIGEWWTRKTFFGNDGLSLPPGSAVEGGLSRRPQELGAKLGGSQKPHAGSFAVFLFACNLASSLLGSCGVVDSNSAGYHGAFQLGASALGSRCHWMPVPPGDQARLPRCSTAIASACTRRVGRAIGARPACPQAVDLRAPTPVSRQSRRLDQLKLKCRISPTMDSLAHHRRRDNAASSNGSSSHPANQHRRQDGNALGMTTARRSISPAAVAVNRSSESARDRDRDRARKHHPSSSRPPAPPPPPPPAPPQQQQQHHPRRPSIDPAHSDSHHHRRGRTRSPERRSGRPSHPSHPSHRSPRSRRDRSRFRSREPTHRREPRGSPDRRDRGSPRPRKDDRERPDPHVRRRASRSPAPSKRRRSPSPPFGRDSQPKKVRQDASPARPERGVPPKSLHSKADRGPAPLAHRTRSPAPRDRPAKPLSLIHI